MKDAKNLCGIVPDQVSNSVVPIEKNAYFSVRLVTDLVADVRERFQDLCLLVDARNDLARRCRVVPSDIIADVLKPPDGLVCPS